MRDSLVYSALFHAIFIGAFFHHLLSLGTARQNSFYTIDLTVQNFASSATSEASEARGPDVVTPVVSEDYLPLPSKIKKAKFKSVSSARPASTMRADGAKAGGNAKALVGIDGAGGLGNFPFPFYAQVIQKKITMNWSSDYWSKGLLTRKAQVAFTINRDGSISNAQVVEKSGDSYFDLTSLRGVSLAAPFPPLPEGFAGDQLRIVFSFEIATP